MAKTTAVILTGQELRHDYFRIKVADDDRIDVLLSVCENKVALSETIASSSPDDPIMVSHLAERVASEKAFFGGDVSRTRDKSNPTWTERNSINLDRELIERICDLKPEILICYGTSIIREPLLSAFDGRFLNIHLGLSPYYRGSGTNFWPFVNREPECVGVTFMHIDAGVDTGLVVHQMRATLMGDDTIHAAGNRLIRQIAAETPRVAAEFADLQKVPQSEINVLRKPEKVYRMRDFNGNAVRQARSNLADKMIPEYLAYQSTRDDEYPIVKGWR